MTVPFAALPAFHGAGRHAGDQCREERDGDARARWVCWLKSRTQTTGAFIGAHVRIGANAALTLDSAFK